MIALIDYGMGNLHSVQKALERAGGRTRLARSASELAGASKIVLPGVAAFGDAMEQLRAQGLVEPIIAAVQSGTPYLGFCLGLQLLFEVGTEQGEHKGLGLLGGRVEKFDFTPRGQSSAESLSAPVWARPESVPAVCGSSSAAPQSLRIPHMGWNQIHITHPCPMLAGIDDGSYVYFAHSYYPVPTDKSIVATTTDYGADFCSSVWQGNIFATQFHPEKSQAIGLRLLENFVNL